MKGRTKNKILTLMRHFKKPVSVEDVCEGLGISRGYAYRKICDLMYDYKVERVGVNQYTYREDRFKKCKLSQ